MQVDIRELSNYHLDKDISIRGRVHKIVVKKTVVFIILRYQTASLQIIAVKGVLGLEQFSELVKLTPESVVDCTGLLRKSLVKIESTSYHNYEMDLLKFTVISLARPLPFQIEDANDFGESFRSNVTSHTRLENRWIDLRVPVNNAIFKIQSSVTQYFREFLLNNKFIEIHTPKLIGVASEGGAQVFELKYFDRPAYLAQSPQLYKQMAINSDFDRVFEIGPVFRAEQSLTIRHMCEFVGLDIEMAISLGQTYTQVQELLWSTLVYILDMLKVRSTQELATIKEKIPFIEPVYPTKPLIIKFKDCVQILRNDGKVQDDFADLSSENEKRLGEIIKDKYNSDLFIIDQYPAAVRPFYTMRSLEDPRYSNSYDVIFKCTEISSGSQREHDYDRLMEKVVESNVNPETLKYYLESFSHGSRPHGGAGLGLERIVSLYLDLGNVKMASFCPRDPKRLFP